MDIDSLLDSVRVNTAADDFARTWRKRGVSHEEKRMRLEALYVALTGAKVAPVTLPVAEALAPSEVAAYAAQADQAMRDVPNVPEKMDRLMAQYILPAVKQGQVKVRVPISFEGRPLPSSNKVWLAALQRAGIHREEIAWGTAADGLPVSAAPMGDFRVLDLG